MSISYFIASGCQIATTHLYRCIHLQEQLGDLGRDAEIAIWNDEAQVDLERALRFDVIWLYRIPMNGPLGSLIEQARSLGKPVIFDTDDLIFEPELVDQQRAVEKLSPNEQRMHAEGVQRYLQTLEACDTVVTATPLLAELARRRAKPAYVHRNCLGREMTALAAELYARRRDRARDQVVITYGSGTATHDRDFEEAAPALAEILARFREVELWIAGPLALPGSLAIFDRRVRRFPLTGWREWITLLSDSDIAIAPLERGNIFCRAKSEIKFIESGAVGVPLVASEIDPFRDAMTDGEDGLLAPNENKWIESLAFLIEQPNERKRMGDRARVLVIDRHSPRAGSRGLRYLLPQLAPELEQPVGSKKTVRWPRRLSARSLKINWLVPEPFAKAGGDMGIFRIIRYLAEFGHRCEVYVVTYNSMTNYASDQIRSYVEKNFGETAAQYRRFEGEIENADCSFATFWPTVEILSGLLKGGRRYYLVQDFEPDFYPDDPLHYRRAENTYRAGLHCITLGPWLTRRLRKSYKAQADYFDFAVDHDIYWPKQGVRPKQQRICFYARPATPRRGYELGLAAFELLSREMPELQIVFFGADEVSPAPSFPFTNYGKLQQEELAALFSSCDAGVVLSLSNPSFVPLEMIACGCVVVEMASDRWDGILTHRRDAWLVEKTPRAIAEGLKTILTNKGLREQLRNNALRRSQKMSWRESARQIEEILRRDNS
ncbi:MAG TPA: glycosyltransferase [Chthoniobacterales bacterium]